ncbi:MAG TPA: chemotaxis protein CheW [Thermoanaerobaculia bacterium]|jgi:purine-binding chemotaxis protein CheW|nr:chemotaxis protein CheW [Thermoanaerobaculia bacterium]
MSGIPELPQAPAAPVPAVSPAPPAPATPAVTARPPAPPPRLALFRLGGRLCGVAAAFCKQFVQLDAVTPVPLAPAYLLGVTQLRGHILPVLDASQLPGLSGLPGLPPSEAPGAPSARGGGQPTTAGGRQALVVTATGLDSALAALAVTEIVGFERPSFAAPGAAPAAASPGDAGGTVPGDAGSAAADHLPTGPPAGAAMAGARPLWRGEEVAVLDVAAILAGLRPGAPPQRAARAEQAR